MGTGAERASSDPCPHRAACMPLASRSGHAFPNRRDITQRSARVDTDAGTTTLALKRSGSELACLQPASRCRRVVALPLGLPSSFALIPQARRRATLLPNGRGYVPHHPPLTPQHRQPSLSLTPTGGDQTPPSSSSRKEPDAAATTAQTALDGPLRPACRVRPTCPSALLLPRYRTLRCRLLYLPAGASGH